MKHHQLYILEARKSYIVSTFEEVIENNFFPSDFFEPISPTNMNNSNQINYNSRNKSKSTYVNLQKEEEEDRELLELLEGKRKNFLLLFFHLW